MSRKDCRCLDRRHKKPRWKNKYLYYTKLEGLGCHDSQNLKEMVNREGIEIEERMERGLRKIKKYN